MDAQIEAGINEVLMSSYRRVKIRDFFDKRSADPEVERFRYGFMLELLRKNGEEFANTGIQQILQRSIDSGSEQDKMRIAQKFVTRIQSAIATIPPETETEPVADPSAALNTTVAEDAGLNTSVFEEVGVRKGGRKTRRKQRKHRKTRHRR